MHHVRVHHRRVVADESNASPSRVPDATDTSDDASPSRPTVKNYASPGTSNDTSDASGGSPVFDASKAEHEDLFECPERCGALFRDEAGIDGHIEEAHTEAPPLPPTEGLVVGQVAESLPRPIPVGLFTGQDRLVRVRSILASARRKAARHPDRDSEQIVRMFWDGSDRKVLESLRSKGVDILGRTSVEGEGRVE